MNDSAAAGIRERLNELRVGPMPIEPIGPVRDYSLDAIGARDLTRDEVEIMDRTGRSWIGNPDVALAALADVEPTGIRAMSGKGSPRLAKPWTVTPEDG
jgi:hypothetical protein